MDDEDYARRAEDVDHLNITAGGRLSLYENFVITDASRKT